ncbi:MAG: efflux RND transporter periplasmic adaptor subunit [Halofilum sp. (in: g-proteobacteria)]|nr:efflux RND transporter periplasmic adaptor subunit [Halofilum sp. (in: g-proteobacteria)]
MPGDAHDGAADHAAHRGPGPGPPGARRDAARQIAGQVEVLVAEPGQQVLKGQVLVRLALEDREARLAEAEALLRQREAEHEAAERLRDSGFQARLRLDQARAAASARAAVERIRLEIWHTEITAPFDGVVDERLVDVGDYAGREQAVVRVVEQRPAWTGWRNLSQRRLRRRARHGARAALVRRDP